jgi:deoxycytidine triphosphate deaminase
MSVIALNTDGASPSVITRRDQLTLYPDAILIIDGDTKQLGPNTADCNASYDLRVGEKYRDHRNDDSGETVVENGFIDLPAGVSIIIQTQEVVVLPKCRFGHIVPKVKLLQQGLANTPTKVDPGFDGHLLITVFNHGKRTLKLARHQPFCAMYVMTVEGPVRPYDKPGPTIEKPPSVKRWQRAVDFFDRHLAAFMFLSLVVSAISLVHSIWKK